MKEIVRRIVTAKVFELFRTFCNGEQQHDNYDNHIFPLDQLVRIILFLECVVNTLLYQVGK